MANVSVTASNVSLVTPDYETGVLSGTVDAGDIVAFSTVTQRWSAAADDVAAGVAVRMAISSGFAGQVIGLAPAGAEVSLGSVLTKRGVYAISPSTAGAIAPIADVTSSDVLFLVGYAKDASTMVLLLKYTGVTGA